MSRDEAIALALTPFPVVDQPPPAAANSGVASAGLSPREVDVLRLLTAGRSNREIAAELFISTRTVERHIENLYRKLDIHSRADAIAYGRQHLT